jgi:DNA-binding FadR family transcriptional regulator
MSDSARAKKLGELVAHRITQEIIERGWLVGQLIGREHELMSQHGVSRSTVREAIRQLERAGVAQMKRGLGGGLVVATQPGAAASGVLATYLELVCDRAEDPSETRLVLERLAARLLAERIGPEEAAGLRALAAEPPPAGLAFSAFNAFRAFDHALIERSGNPALVLFIGALDVMFDRLAAHAGGATIPSDLATQVHRERAALVEAVIGRDWSRIDAIVEQRVQSYAQVVELARRAFSARPDDREARPEKLSHIIAQQIVQDLKRANAQPGDLFGLEAEVQARYQVGRGVIREALRILEPHGLIQIRSGSSGGMVVGRPSPAYTLDLLLTYLRYMRMRMRDLWLVQGELEIYAAGRAAQHASDEGAAEIRRRAERAAAAPLDAALAEGNAFHRSIVENCGDPVLELFGSAMIAYGAITLPPVEPEVARVAHDIGLRIAEAVQSRDAMFARRYMDETFRISRKWLQAAAS